MKKYSIHTRRFKYSIWDWKYNEWVADGYGILEFVTKKEAKEMVEKLSKCCCNDKHL